MLNSKELLERTGISRATLNNYIALGIVPRPDVLPPEPQDGAAPRIGYFPDGTVQRIAEIQRLKNEGWSMAAIAEHFAPGRAGVPAGRPIAGTGMAAPATAPARDLPRLSPQDIVHPAYLLDEGFAVLWSNTAGAAIVGPAAGEAKALPGLLRAAGQREDLLRFHLEIAKGQSIPLATIAGELAAGQRASVERLYSEAPGGAAPPASHVVLPAQAGAAAVCVYAMRFREGTLFVHVPPGRAAEEFAFRLAGGESAGADAPKRRRPFLSDVAVLAMDLQDAARIWSALPAEEYFELIDEIWLAAEPVFRRHHGIAGKHPGDGIVCYFLPQRDTDYLSNALAAAVDMREAMRRVSKEWQLRKRWTTELYMNTGLDEGQQWLGGWRAAGQLDFTMFGDTLNRAVRLSDFARFGAVWAAKNLVLKVPPEQKQRFKYGVHRRDREGRHVFVPSVFATVDRLAEGSVRAEAPPHDIGRLAITEIVDIAPAERRRERAADPHPI